RDANTVAEGKPYSVFGASLLAAGYEYDLSKRTALYATVSRVWNKDAGKVGVNTASSYSALPTAYAGGGSGGAEVGIRHSF
ncbi:MAG: hypothetical protein JO370_15960, partial [Paucibacter sp.]|nr:hypothetical protein [Roseateles sp.]